MYGVEITPFLLNLYVVSQKETNKEILMCYEAILLVAVLLRHSLYKIAQINVAISLI